MFVRNSRVQFYNEFTADLIQPPPLPTTLPPDDSGDDPSTPGVKSTLLNADTPLKVLFNFTAEDHEHEVVLTNIKFTERVVLYREIEKL